MWTQHTRQAAAILSLLACAIGRSTAHAALVTDPNDPRNWQGATVGTFATLFYGSNTPANRQLVVDNQLLDDSNFNAAGYTSATMIRFNGVNVIANPAFGSYGSPLDQPNVNNGVNQGTYNYTCCSGGAAAGGNGIDEKWIQPNNTFSAATAALLLAVPCLLVVAGCSSKGDDTPTQVVAKVGSTEISAAGGTGDEGAARPDGRRCRSPAGHREAD